MPLELVYIIGTVLLGGALAYGYIRTKQRTPKEKAVSETAAREMRRHPDEYEDHIRDDLKEEVRKE